MSEISRVCQRYHISDQRKKISEVVCKRFAIRCSEISKEEARRRLLQKLSCASPQDSKKGISAKSEDLPVQRKE
jgi:hypothetical protein